MLQRVRSVYAPLDKQSKLAKWAAAAQVAHGHPVFLLTLDILHARCTLCCDQADSQPLGRTIDVGGPRDTAAKVNEPTGKLSLLIKYTLSSLKAGRMRAS